MDTKQQADFGAKLAANQPAKWELIPDLGLYMDQVITYLGRQLQPVYPDGERVFTPAMVNNYVKMGLVSRPEGKKYGREQLAQLLMICLLKQGATAEEMKRLLLPAQGETVEQVYERFCLAQTQTFTALINALPLESAMVCAVRNAAYRLLLADMLRPAPAGEPDGEEPQP